MATKSEKAQYSKEMLDNIKNYASEIQTLETFVQQVRQNPGYHLGAIGNKGLINMIREVLQNSLDELDKESSPCDEVSIAFDEQDQSVYVVDNGRGIPFGDIVRVFATSSTSSNYTKKKGEYSSGLHGVGAKVTNAMSSTFIVESYILGEGRRVEFTEGYPWKKGVNGEVEIPKSKATQFQGTFVYFKPSKVALGDTNITCADVLALVNMILPLCKIGAVVNWSGKDAAGNKVPPLKLVNTDGIMAFLNKQVVQPVIAPIECHKDTGFMKMDIAFTWDSSDSASNHIAAFANKCPTTLGTHISGFDQGVTNYFVNYMNKIYLAGTKNKKKITCNAADIRSGLQATVSVYHLKPIFDGQSKEKLSNEEMGPFVASGIAEALDVWQKANPKDMAKICSYFKDMAEIRMSTDNKRIKITDQYSKGINKLPSKYVAPTGDPDKEKMELFIVEGDSAGGHVKTCRINTMQGSFPIRGKIPNAFSTKKEKFLTNPEIAGIISIIGGGYGKSFDITKVKWDKIIICTDADADGDHIAVLLERFFILYMPELIISGKLYRAVPPLYSVGRGKNIKYLHNKVAYIDYFRSNFMKNHTLCDYKGNKLTNKEISSIFYINRDYIHEMQKVVYSIDPILLEIILISHISNDSFATLSKKIKKEMRFNETIKQDKSTGMIIIEGLYKSKYQSIFIDDRLLGECARVIEILKKNSVYVYKLNDRLVTLYELMLEFEFSLPSHLQRYKGLGEMDAHELFESTLDPNNRVLIQYEINDLKAELEAIRYYENNNLSELMVGVKVTRADLLS